MDRVQRLAVFAVWFVQFTQAISITMPYSVVVFTVRDFMATSNTDAATEAHIGKAAGFLAGVYSLAQFLSSYAWGWSSDNYGRKPVIIIGLASSFFSSVTLGFAATYDAAVCSRFIGGLFNGYLVALKSCVAELFEEEQQAKALAYLSFGWGAGSTFGPVLGGFLMHPCDKYALGAVCSKNGIFQAFPYLLPYLFSAATAILSIACTQYMLPETHSSYSQLATAMSGWKQWPNMLASFVRGRNSSDHNQENSFKLLSKQRDGSAFEMELVPTELIKPVSAFHPGPLISRTHSACSTMAGSASTSQLGSSSASQAGEPERHPLSSSTQPQAAASCGGHLPRRARASAHCIDMVSKECMALSVGGGFEDADELVTHISGGLMLDSGTAALECPAPWYTQRLLLMLISGYGLIAFMFCMLDEVVPIYASTPAQHNGLGMTGSQLSIPFSVGGAVMMIVSVFVYPPVQNKIGCYRCLQIGLLMFVCSCGLYPTCVVINRFNTAAAYITFTITTCIRCISAAFTFTSSMVLINVATSRIVGNQIGAVNGSAQALVAGLRGLAPFLGGYFWSLSVSSSVSTPYSHFAVFLFDVIWACTASILYLRIRDC